MSTDSTARNGEIQREVDDYFAHSRFDRVPQVPLSDIPHEVVAEWTADQLHIMPSEPSYVQAFLEWREQERLDREARAAASSDPSAWSICTNPDEDRRILAHLIRCSELLPMLRHAVGSPAQTCNIFLDPADIFTDTTVQSVLRVLDEIHRETGSITQDPAALIAEYPHRCGADDDSQSAQELIAWCFSSEVGVLALEEVQGLLGTRLRKALRNLLHRVWFNSRDSGCGYFDNAIEAIQDLASKIHQLEVGLLDTQHLCGYSVTELFAEARPPSWLVHQLLAKGATAFIAGPFKSIKSGIALDLAVSLAMPALGDRRAMFLNHFPCEPAKHVLVFTGEADLWEVRQRIELIYNSKPAEVQFAGRRQRPAESQHGAAGLNLTVYFAAPRMTSAEDQRIVREEIRKHKADVVIFDPLYLCALGGGDIDAGNVFKMGEILQGMEKVVKDEGATPIFLHHFIKSVKPGDDPTLGHMAFSGSAERAAQWWLLNHRVPFDPANGQARLMMLVGGRSGQAGAYGVDIIEGRLDDNFVGRRWQPMVAGLEEAKARDRDQGLQSRSGQRASGVSAGPEDLRERILRHLATIPQGESICMTPLSQALHMHYGNCREAVTQLCGDGRVELVPGGYNGHDGYRLTDSGRARAAGRGNAPDNGRPAGDREDNPDNCGPGEIVE